MQISGSMSSRSLVVILGASRFPSAPTFAAGAAFYNSADRLLRYFTDENGMRVKETDILDLFDDTTSPADQLGNIQKFVSSKASAEPWMTEPENLFVYYVGHGLFTTDRKYCLAIRQTNESRVGISAIRGQDLAEIVSQSAPFLRRFLILDCCFAGALFSEFLGGPAEAATGQMLEKLPKRGTALLCASSRTDVALAPKSLEYTMFSNALLKALLNGNPVAGASLTLRELGAMLVHILEQDHPLKWVRPEIHSPDMPEGDLSDIPIFPNRAWLPQQGGYYSLPSVMKEDAERAGSERLNLERQVLDAAAKADRERQVREGAAKAEQEQLVREAADKAEQERQVRETADKADRERQIHEAAKAEQERQVREAADKAEQERQVREAIAKAKQESQVREAIAKAEQESAVREERAKAEQYGEVAFISSGRARSLLLLYRPERPVGWLPRLVFYVLLVKSIAIDAAGIFSGLNHLWFVLILCVIQLLLLGLLRAWALWIDLGGHPKPAMGGHLKTGQRDS